jgi:PAS domain S-box-containing protein
VLTVDGHGRLAYANPAAEELLGIDASVWLDREVLEELGQRSPDLQRALERACRHGLPVASAEVPVRRNGEIIPVGISTALLERGDGPPSVTAIMRDISDRKRVERLRQRAERLEAVAELSAALAHEIKNPLASISSSVQQLRLREVADDDDRLLSGLILKESDRLSRLLSDFIDFARVQIERTKELDLRRVVRDAVSVVLQHPSYRDEIEIDVRLDEGPVLFHGDEDLMHRVVTNLVLNAVQAAVPGRGGRVSVEARGDDVGRTPQGVDLIDPVVLSVADDGPGIPEGDLERIFDPFFSKRRGGTGLGLAIVHRAVREHNGVVVVTSSARAGTRFTVYLPRVMAIREKAKETQES